MTTDADVEFVNDWDTETEVKSTNDNMDNKLPNPLKVAARSTSPSHYVDCKFFGGQSGFELNYRGSSISVNLGQGIYSTGINHIKGPEFEAGAVLAPINPLTAKTCYRFIFFAGPSLLAPLINSHIQANLHALLHYLNTNPIDLGKFGPFTVVIQRFRADSLACVYASMTPAGPSQWRFNAIINFTGMVGAYFAWDNKFTGVLDVYVKTLSICVQGKLDLQDLEKPTFALSTFQVSMFDYEIESNVLPRKPSPTYTMCGLVNTKFNEDIIGGLNDLVRRVFDGKTLKPPQSTSNALTPGPSVTRRTWMSDPTIQTKPLGLVTFPGSHDAHAFWLSTQLGQIKYPDDEFLWDLSPDYAPLDHKVPPWGHKVKYLGPNLYNYTIRRLMFTCLTHAADLTTQLTEGIRWFDIRPYWDTEFEGGTLCTQHGLRGAKLHELLLQVRAFLDSVSSSREVIMLVLSHANFDWDSTPKDVPAKVASTVEETLGPYVYWPPTAEPGKPYDFNQLLNVKMCDIATDGPRVLVLNGDGFALPKPLINSGGFGDGDKQIWMSVVPDVTEIVFNVAAAFAGEEQLLLKQLSVPGNARVRDELAKKDVVNLVGMDWYNYYGGEGESPMDAIMKKNGVSVHDAIESFGVADVTAVKAESQDQAFATIASWEPTLDSSLDLASIVKTTPETTAFALYNIKSGQFIGGSNTGDMLLTDSRDLQWTATELNEMEGHCTLQVSGGGKYLGISASPCKAGDSLALLDVPFTWAFLFEDAGGAIICVPGSELAVTAREDGSLVVSAPSGESNEGQLWDFWHM